MKTEEALVEVVAYMQGLGDTVSPEQGAALLVEQLAKRGFSVQPFSAPILTDIAPETLRRVRESLGYPMSHVSAVAGIKAATGRRIEAGEVTPHKRTLAALVEALIRLGARRVDSPTP